MSLNLNSFNRGLFDIDNPKNFHNKNHSLKLFVHPLSKLRAFIGKTDGEIMSFNQGQSQMFHSSLQSLSLSQRYTWHIILITTMTGTFSKKVFIAVGNAVIFHPVVVDCIVVSHLVEMAMLCYRTDFFIGQTFSQEAGYLPYGSVDVLISKKRRKRKKLKLKIKCLYFFNSTFIFNF